MTVTFNAYQKFKTENKVKAVITHKKKERDKSIEIS